MYISILKHTISRVTTRVSICYRIPSDTNAASSLQALSSWTFSCWHHLNHICSKTSALNRNLDEFGMFLLMQPAGSCFWRWAWVEHSNIWTIIKVFHGVSKNRVITPKSSTLIGFSLINHPFWGTPIFGNTHMFIYLLVASYDQHPCLAPKQWRCWMRHWYAQRHERRG